MTGTSWLMGNQQSAPDPEPEDDHVIRLNPLYYWEEREENQQSESQDSQNNKNVNTSPKKKTGALFVYWNPDFVSRISVQGKDLTPEQQRHKEQQRELQQELHHELQQQFMSWQNDRSLPVSTTISPQKETAPVITKQVEDDEGNQSDDSADIDEELFTMEDIPAPAEPKLLSKRTPHSRTLHEDIIKELSEKLAISRERQLLMTVVSKSQRFHSMKSSLPDFSFYNPVATSSTPSTWKAPKQHFSNNVRIHSALVQQANYGSLPDFAIPSYHYKSKSKPSSLVGSLTSRPTVLGPLVEETVSVPIDEPKAGPAHQNGGASNGPQQLASDSKDVSDPSMHPYVLPVLKELDLLLSKSRTLQTFKLKVRQAQEQMTLAELGLNNIEDASKASPEANNSVPSWVPKAFLRRRRMWQVGFAVLLLLLFLAMLVGLSVCCSSKLGQ